MRRLIILCVLPLAFSACLFSDGEPLTLGDVGGTSDMSVSDTTTPGDQGGRADGMEATDMNREDAVSPVDIGPDVVLGPCELVDCAPGTQCDDATGECVSICDPTQDYCGDQCVNVGDNPMHCGACDVVCDDMTPQDSHTRACTNGECVFECDADRADINGDLNDPAGDGCEAACTPTSPPAEVCDGIDNDCNGAIDDALPRNVYYADNDSDGFGDPNNTSDFCEEEAPQGWSANSEDCDDSETAINPSATEICDGIDNDCAGGADDGLVEYTWWLDTDGDGVGGANVASPPSCDAQPPGAEWVASSNDCDDDDDQNYPGNSEVCDMADNDCDTVADNGLPSFTYYEDFDMDTWGNDSLTIESCENSAPAGFVARDGDCNDTNAMMNPGATELCDGVDSNCSGDQEVQVPFYLDGDGDGYGGTTTVISCTGRPASYVAQAGDCDDGDPNRSPGLAEQACDGIDNDCNAATDDNNAVMCRHTIFVTSNTWLGSFNVNQSADGKCATAAAGVAGSWGTWKAVIYDGTLSASQRIRQVGVVANTANVALWDVGQMFVSNPLAPIGYNQAGVATSTPVWSGTTTSGGVDTAHCNGFSTIVSAANGTTATPLFSDGRWIDNNSSSACNKPFAIYCIDGQR